MKALVAVLLAAAALGQVAERPEVKRWQAERTEALVCRQQAIAALTSQEEAALDAVEARCFSNTRPAGEIR